MNRNKILAILFVAISILFTSPISINKIEDVTKTDVPIENDIFDRVSYYKEHPEILNEKTEPIRNAKMLATIADAVAPDSDDICKIAIMDCIVNRSKTTGFPNTIESVCLEKNQWQGYTYESTYTDETYILAKNYLANLGSVRVSSIDSNMIYLRLGNHGIFFRAEWDTNTETYVPYYTA